MGKKHRSWSAINEAEQHFFDIVWYGRHMGLQRAHQKGEKLPFRWVLGEDWDNLDTLKSFLGEELATLAASRKRGRGQLRPVRLHTYPSQTPTRSRTSFDDCRDFKK